MNKIKYRPYKKGDIVALCTCLGREPRTIDNYTPASVLGGGPTYLIDRDESTDFNSVAVTNKEGGAIAYIPPCFLRLITPTEKTKPYTVIDSPLTFNIVDLRRKGNGCVITLHKSDLFNTRELADKLCSNLNATVGDAEFQVPCSWSENIYEMVLNEGGKCWTLRHTATDKTHVSVFFGEDGFKLTKDMAKAATQMLKDFLDPEIVGTKPTEATSTKTPKSLNLPCASCTHWAELRSHGSSSFGSCSVNKSISSCWFVGPFDVCPDYNETTN
jgi:hypothetical protein